MDSEKQMVIANLLNNAIQDEWEAIETYNSIIATLSDYDGEDIDGIIANLEDIRDEEYVHVGQLESCLSVLKGDPVEQIGDGSEEGFEKLELPEEDDEDSEEETEVEEESLKEAHSYGWGRVSDSWDEYDDGNHTFTLYINDKKVDSDYDIQSLISRAEDSDGFAEIWVDDEDLDHAVWTNESLQKPNGKTLEEDVSEEEMKKVICSMITQYDASEEEVYDELSIANPDISRDLVHRLYQMCSGNEEEPQQETSFEDFWNELEDTEED